MHKKIRKIISSLLIFILLLGNIPVTILAQELEPTPEPTPVVETTPTPEPSSIPEPTPTPTPVPSPTPETDVNLGSQAGVVDEVDSTANTGNNGIVSPSPTPTPSPEALPTASPEGEVIEEPASGSASIDTGDALFVVDVVNVVNTNEVNSDVEVTNINVSGTQEGDLDLSQISNDQPATEAAGPVELENASVDVTIDNQAKIENDIVLFANSGENAIDGGGDGVINTGDAYAAANVFNLINSNVINSELQIVVINIFGNLVGDIVLPEFIVATGSCCAFSLTVSNSADVNNKVSSTANTGNNQIVTTGEGSIVSGQAISSVDILNIINSNLYGIGLYRLQINNYGVWNGEFLGWQNLPSEGLAQSNECPDCIASATITNQALVTNTINSSANTGGNTMNASGSSSIKTGNAYSSVSLTNIVNTNLVNVTGWLGLINIFGRLDGNIGGASFFATPTPEPTPTPEAEIAIGGEDVLVESAPDDSCPTGGYLEITQSNNVGTHVLPGDTVTFFMTVKNPSTGQVNSSYVNLNLQLDGENVGGTTINLGNMAPGKSKKIGTGLVLSTLAPGGNYTAHAEVVGCIGPGKQDTSSSVNSYFKVLALASYLPLSDGAEVGSFTQEGVGDVLGASDTQFYAGDASCGSCVWWQILAVQLAVLLFFYFFMRPKNKYIAVTTAAIITILTFAVFRWFNQGCVSEFWGCKFFWLECLVVFGLTTLVTFNKKAV